MAEIKAEDIKPDNPAGRLYRILADAHKHDGGAIKQMWSKVLGFNDSSTPELNGNLLQLHDLVAEVKEKLTQAGEETGINFLESFRDIEGPINITNLDQPWNTPHVREKLNPQFSAMTNLRQAAQYLSKNHPDPEIEETELTEILKEVNSLLEEVLSAGSLNAHLKQFIIGRLEQIRQAILYYEHGLGGPEVFRKVYTDTLGELFFRKIPVDAEDDESPETVEENRNFFGKFSKLVEKVGKLAERGIIVTAAIFTIADSSAATQLLKKHAPALLQSLPKQIEDMRSEAPQQMEHRNPEDQEDEQEEKTGSDVVATIPQVVSKEEEEEGTPGE